VIVNNTNKLQVVGIGFRAVDDTQSATLSAYDPWHHLYSNSRTLTSGLLQAHTYRRCQCGRDAVAFSLTASAMRIFFFVAEAPTARLES